MKTEIYYFTGTGNSLAAARELEKHISGSILIPIKSCYQKKLAIQAEVIGLVFPVYFGSIPDIVKQFIDGLSFSVKKPYIFAVATCNGVPLSSINILNNALTEKGQKLSLYCCLDMPGNAAQTPEAMITERLERYKEKMKCFATEIKQQTVLDVTSSSMKKIQTHLLEWFGSKYYLSPRQLCVNENCIGCGICAKVCPMKNIQFDYQKEPYWKTDCTRCLACFHWCPQNAVYFKGRKKQYHHPEIKLEDMINISVSENI